MLVLISIQFMILLAASALLLLEVRAGNFAGLTERRSVLSASTYMLAAIMGATLLITLADGEWLFALALVPITFLSLLRFSMIVRQWWTGWKLPVYTCAFIAVGIMATLPMMPSPLNRTFVLEELNLIDTSLERPDSINPEAVRTVRA